MAKKKKTQGCNILLNVLQVSMIVSFVYIPILWAWVNLLKNCGRIGSLPASCLVHLIPIFDINIGIFLEANFDLGSMSLNVMTGPIPYYVHCFTSQMGEECFYFF